MNQLSRIALFLSGFAAVALAVGIGTSAESLWQPAALFLAISLAIGIGAIPALKGYQYTVWIIAAVVAGMIYPAAFTKWGDFDLRNKWLILIIIQTVMFGMGIHMSVRDFSSLAIGIGAIPALKGYQYTVWIIAAVVAGMIYPAAFTKWGDFDLRNKWLILIIIQTVMFGMGIHMSVRDFSSLATTGKGVLIGLLCHFSIMPLMGLLLTKIFDFEPEIAAGVILIGSCSSGLASNVMVYLAKANLVLSVIVTAMATLVAPFLTPLLMKLLAGTLIEVHFVDMMMEIIKIIIVPIGAALLHDYLKTASAKSWQKVWLISGICAIWLIALPLGLWNYLKMTVASHELLQSLEILGFFAGAFLVGVLYHLLTLRFNKLDSLMPYFSMFGIIYFTTVTTAAGRDNLMKVGFLLFVCSVIHNAAGYFFGYWLSRLFGLDKNSSRTVAFEVGLQNGGMASGLAGSMGKLGTVGLPATVFSPWMNISGSILANYWRKRPVETTENRVPTIGETLVITNQK